MFPSLCLHSVAFVRLSLFNKGRLAHSVTLTCFPPDLPPQRCVICSLLANVFMFHLGQMCSAGSWEATSVPQSTTFFLSRNACCAASHFLFREAGINKYSYVNSRFFCLFYRYIISQLYLAIYLGCAKLFFCNW